MPEKILILDFGSQYTQLIARRVRELNVYCEIHPYNKIPEIDEQTKGLILSGSPCSVNDVDPPMVSLDGFRQKMPVLGICYGAQMMAKMLGGTVAKSKIREYGKANLSTVHVSHDILSGVEKGSQVWMSHADSIVALPDEFVSIAETKDIPVAAFRHVSEKIYGLQFHPEVTHSLDGKAILNNFIGICGCSKDWNSDHFVNSKVAELKELLGDDKVVLGLSGGVDSTVTGVLINKAIGNNLTSIFVDNGLLRKDEFESVLENYKGMGLNVIGVDASQKFYKALAGISDPEEKRKAIGRTFIEVFDAEADKIEGAKWLGQGTIYPDIIESVSVNGPSQTIKSHHNVGGLPDFMKLKIVEPLNSLFKDEVRRVGRSMGIAPKLIGRHPFPGPGLAIRILGDVTPGKVKVLQEVDHIFISKLHESGWYDKVWQAGTMLLPVKSVGVMGDERTYENVVALRAVSSMDGMTADWSRLPQELLADISNSIINKVKGVNRVVYDISSKPPSTIEWE